MKTTRRISLALLLTLFVAACGINDLEDRVDNLEGMVAGEPMTISFTTKTYEDNAISKSDTYKIRPSVDYNYIYKYQTGIYEVYVTRLKDINWSESAWIDFDYNPETKEVSSPQVGFEFYDEYFNWYSQYFCTEAYCGSNYAGMAVTVTVKSFDTSTGFVDFNVVASSTANTPVNRFDGNLMNATMKFKGKLAVRKEE